MDTIWYEYVRTYEHVKVLVVQTYVLQIDVLGSMQSEMIGIWGSAKNLTHFRE